MKRIRFWLGVLVAVLVLAEGTNARALSMVPGINLVDLLAEAQDIFAGSVTNVTDGINDLGLPYTEITVLISETFRGNLTGTYSFRQLGLMKPRPMADGLRTMAAAPEGIPRYAVGERVVLFLGEPASVTGLRMTVDFGYGKFVLGAGAAYNDYNNSGTFDSVSLADGLAAGNDARILSTKLGAVNPDDFLSMLRRATQGAWVQNGLMWKTSEGHSQVKPVKPGDRPVN